MNTPFQRKAPFRVLCLLVFLSLSLVVLGLGGFISVGSVPREMEGVFQQEFLMLGVVRDITRDSNATRRYATSAFSAESETMRKSANTLFENSSSRNDLNFQRLQSLLDGESVPEFLSLQESREEYRNAVRSALSLFPTPREDIEAVDQLFTNYQNRQDDLANWVQDRVIEKKELFERRVGRLGIFFIIVALWPLVLALLAFTYVLAHTTFLFVRARRA